MIAPPEAGIGQGRSEAGSCRAESPFYRLGPATVLPSRMVAIQTHARITSARPASRSGDTRLVWAVEGNGASVGSQGVWVLWGV